MSQDYISCRNYQLKYSLTIGFHDTRYAEINTKSFLHDYFMFGRIAQILLSFLQVSFTAYRDVEIYFATSCKKTIIKTV